MKMKKLKGQKIVFIFIALFLPCVASALQINASWGGGNSNWNNAANWDTGVVPNNSGGNTYNVLIDNSKTGINSVVSLDMNAAIDNLTIDSGDTLNQNQFKSLSIAGTSITNNGTYLLCTYLLNSVTLATDLKLIGASDVAINGTGTLSMSDSTNNRIYSSTGSNFTIGANQVIEGAG